MDDAAFIGALAKGDTSGYEVLTLTCPKHGKYQFHPAVVGARHVDCPRCAVGNAKVKRGVCKDHGPWTGRDGCSYCVAAQRRAEVAA